MFHILAAIDEFQRELIVEGTNEGLAAARARGRTGGRKPKLNPAQAGTLHTMYEAKDEDGRRLHTVKEIADALQIDRTTVYDYLNGTPSRPRARRGDGAGAGGQRNGRPAQRGHSPQRR